MTEVQDRTVARINARAEQKRLDRAAEIQLERERLALAEERRQAEVRRRAARQAERAEARAQKKAARVKARAALLAKARATAPQVAKTLLIAVPILAPMTVAWIGQIDFALDTLGWVFLGALAFAAAWELTTAFTAWMYHQARQEGDRGTLYRFATWLFAASAGAMNYWHACPIQMRDGREVVLLDPTPKAVSFGVMSLVGIGVWELYATLIHRKKLRADGKLPPARPKFGVAWWLRYPVTTWTAWSLAFRYQIPTSEQAWAMAVARLDSKSGPASQPTMRVKVGRLLVVRAPGSSAAKPTFPRVLTTPWGGFSLAAGHGVGGPATWFDARQLDMEPVVFEVPETTVEPTSRRVVRTTSEPTPESTAEPMDSSAPESTAEPTDGTTRKPNTKGGSKRAKRRRRSRDELRAELEQRLAEHYAQPNPGEIKVLPLAQELGSTRKTIRELLDEMNVRPIRKAVNR